MLCHFFFFCIIGDLNMLAILILLPLRVNLETKLLLFLQLHELKGCVLYIKL
jgi:hypothetical protein